LSACLSASEQQQVFTSPTSTSTSSAASACIGRESRDSAVAARHPLRGFEPFSSPEPTLALQPSPQSLFTSIRDSPRYNH
jgi:hypothetical protein